MSLGACLQIIKVVAIAWYSIKICVIFGVRLKDEKVDNSKPTRKLKYAIDKVKRKLPSFQQCIVMAFFANPTAS